MNSKNATTDDTEKREEKKVPKGPNDENKSPNQGTDENDPDPDLSTSDDDTDLKKAMNMWFMRVERGPVPEHVPIYQLVIVMKWIEPKIWRRIQIPSNYDFLEFHLAIREAFGWNATHLFVFKVKDLTTGRKVHIGEPKPPPGHNMAEAYFGRPARTIKDGKVLYIKDYFKEVKHQGTYMYDFGDKWVHKIWLEKILTPAKDESYPKCIGGKRAGPPEDAGGYPGYINLLRILGNPRDPEYQEIIEWLTHIGKGNFNPEFVDISKIFKD